MGLVIGVSKERIAHERRVALVPESVDKLKKLGAEIRTEAGAGEFALFSDDNYSNKGAKIEPESKQILNSSDILVKVRVPDPSEAELMKDCAVIIGLLDPHSSGEVIRIFLRKKITSFAFELLPRITRAQAMDVLSSMSTVAGYKSVLLAAERLDKMFPMLMTAAGTIAPARAFIIGAGVAGLQAIATAKRLGAVVEAYDVRPVVKEQVQSLGARFVELDIRAQDAQDKGGYAKEQSEEFLKRQRELLKKHLSTSDLVITTALIPGKKAPVLITEDMVKSMKRGSVLVDLAAEQGGNCELTEAGKEIEKHGALIMGPVNIASSMPAQSSLLYSRNAANFLAEIMKDGALKVDMTDELIRGTALTHNGEIVNEGIRNKFAAAVQS